MVAAHGLPPLGRGPGGADAVVDRVSPGDLMELAVDAGPRRVQFGAVLVLAPSDDGIPDAAQDEADDAVTATAERLLADRVTRIPRLRQVLRAVPLGCGRPVWVDDAEFDARYHVRRVTLPPPGGEGALMRAAARIVSAPMPYSRPLWRAAVVRDPAQRRTAVVFAVHHVLADGIGGLAVLSRLVDEAGDVTDSGTPSFPRPVPSRRQLADDAMRGRVAALGRASRGLATFPSAMARVKVQRPPAVPRTSLTVPVSGGLRTAFVRVPLSDVHDAAGREDATVNDALLSAVAGALREILASRGEPLGRLTVSVPVSLRSADDPVAAGSAEFLGNAVGTMVVSLPTGGPPAERLRTVARTTRIRRTEARTGSGRILVTVFRGMAAIGVLRPFIERQSMIQTFVSDVRGPDEPVTLAGVRVTAIVPLTTLAGNVTTSFVALSYAGDLAVAVNADPAVVPDPDGVARLLEAELMAIAGLRWP